MVEGRIGHGGRQGSSCMRDASLIEEGGGHHAGWAHPSWRRDEVMMQEGYVPYRGGAGGSGRI